jgi:hypothetical protein
LKSVPSSMSSTTRSAGFLIVLLCNIIVSRRITTQAGLYSPRIFIQALKQLAKVVRCLCLKTSNLSTCI